MNSFGPDNQVIHCFLDVSIGKQCIKITVRNLLFFDITNFQNHIIVSFSMILFFYQKELRVMMHTKIKDFMGKAKSCQNHERSCISGYRLRKLKKGCYRELLRKSKHFGHF